MIPVRSQWGRYDLPICMYIYIICDIVFGGQLSSYGWTNQTSSVYETSLFLRPLVKINEKIHTPNFLVPYLEKSQLKVSIPSMVNNWIHQGSTIEGPNHTNPTNLARCEGEIPPIPSIRAVISSIKYTYYIILYSYDIPRISKNQPFTHFFYQSSASNLALH